MVENNNSFAKTVCQPFLNQHRVQIVPSLLAARKALAMTAFDVVLVDFDLDGGKGDELVREMRGEDSEQVEVVSMRSPKAAEHNTFTHADANIAPPT